MSLKALKNMSCFVLNSGFYFHLPFVVQLPVPHVLSLHRLGRWQGKKKKPFFHILNLQRGTCPVKTEAHFQAAICIFPQAKKQEAEERKNNI